MALPPKKDKALRTDYYPSVMSAIQRLTNPGAAEDRLKFYVRLRTASQLQFAVEAPDEDAARRNMEDLEAAISRVELELARSRGSAPVVGSPLEALEPPAPVAPPPPKAPPPPPPERPKPGSALGWPPKLAKPIVAPPPPSASAPPPKPPAAFVLDVEPDFDTEPDLTVEPLPQARREPARVEPPRMASARIVPARLDPNSVAPVDMEPPRRRPEPREPAAASVAPPMPVAPPPPTPEPGGVPAAPHLALAVAAVLVFAAAAGVAVWFLAAPSVPAANDVTASIATPAAAAGSIPANTPVRELRRVSPEALIGLRLLMPPALRTEKWAYELAGEGTTLGNVTLSGKPAITGTVCKRTDCANSALSFAITLDGSNGALVLVDPKVNNGRPAFIGVPDGDAAKLAASVFAARTTG